MWGNYLRNSKLKKDWCATIAFDDLYPDTISFMPMASFTVTAFMSLAAQIMVKLWSGMYGRE